MTARVGGAAAVTGRAGRVIHTGQAIVDVVMQVGRVPAAGEDVFASEHALEVGGGFNVMAAARREGAEVLYAGGHGTGPFGDRVREALAAEGIEVLLAARPGMDSGFCVALVDDDAERTFVSTLGAEGHVAVDALDGVPVGPGDVVYVSGYSLLHPDNAAMLARALPRMAEAAQVVVDASPVIGEVAGEALAAVRGAATLWSVNEREAGILAGRVLRERDGAGERNPADVPEDAAGAGAAGTDEASVGADELAAALSQELEAVVLVRVGAGGCWVARPGEAAVHVPGIDVEAVDTNGAGDAHTGVLCADLAAGVPLAEAVRRANVAAGIAVTRRGPATSPTAEEIDQLLTRD
ncbi:PfkB family carbohydrate kinase [Georgenia sp. Z1344]|uniref:PfkB family carbohydrate kinase n=1 Tax=Georgenia sp. Z1344 TaxID=3416706 RepID=UPI003CEFC399